ncbi:MAG: sulfatase-like hydrolase/transferase [Promethearchaeia archaeon]
MSEKMNVLFIMSDQHRADHMGCAGNKIVKTPNLDRLANEGVRFTNAYCSNPMCMPNRATLLTGYYPNVHGVRSNGMILPEDSPMITETLVKRGWYTVGIGKFHHQFDMPSYKGNYKTAESFYDWVFPNDEEFTPTRENFPIPYYNYQEVEMVLGHGTALAGHYMDWLEEKSSTHYKSMKKRWKDPDALFGPFVDSDLTVDLYPNAYIVEKTINFLERHAKGECGDKPFYLHCSFPDPHHPLHPPGRYKNMYKPEDIKLPENFDDLENLSNHPFLKDNINVMPNAMLRETNEKELRKFIAYTYGIITLLDDSIGQVLSAIEKLGYSENTIVVYTSDHGDFMGEHGMLFKGPAPFNGVLQVPMIWKVPKITKSSITDSLISSVDYPKTILSLLGIPDRKHPPEMQGYDMTPILKDSNKKIRDCCLIEQDEEIGPKGPLYCRLRHLITESHKLTVYEGIKGYGDIYDRKNDPHELHNLWYDENFEKKRFELLERLTQELLCTQTRNPKRIAPD